MTRLLAISSLMFAFSRAHGATADAVDVANALLKVASRAEFTSFVDNTTQITSVDFDDEGNNEGTFHIHGIYLNIDMVCGSSELTIRRKQVQGPFGPATLYAATTSHHKTCR